jgi:hypothetical protein
MAFSYRAFLAIFLLAVPLSVRAQEPPADARRFVLFVHAGAATPPDQNLVKKITFALAARGYVVRSPESDRDEIGGPGVDYFADADVQAAKDIAEVVNAQLPPNATKLMPRLQRVKNQPGYIGVWLFR